MGCKYSTENTSEPRNLFQASSSVPASANEQGTCGGSVVVRPKSLLKKTASLSFTDVKAFGKTQNVSADPIKEAPKLIEEILDSSVDQMDRRIFQNILTVLRRFNQPDIKNGNEIRKKAINAAVEALLPSTKDSLIVSNLIQLTLSLSMSPMNLWQMVQLNFQHHLSRGEDTMAEAVKRLPPLESSYFSLFLIYSIAFPGPSSNEIAEEGRGQQEQSEERKSVTKEQRLRQLQLLFYLSLSDDDLRHYLEHQKPALWLVEVGSGKTIAKQSLVHYLKQGSTKFLPVLIDEDTTAIDNMPPTSEALSVDIPRFSEIVADRNIPCTTTCSLSYPHVAEFWTLDQFYVWAEQNLPEEVLTAILKGLLLSQQHCTNGKEENTNEINARTTTDSQEGVLHFLKQSSVARDSK